MRLRTVERGHRLRAKLILIAFRFSGVEPPDVIRTILYRPEFFGEHFSPTLQQLLRGPSDWSVGERELFAAFVSRLNQCLF
jgi:hypothetical protein